MSSLTDEVEVVPGSSGTVVHFRPRLGRQPRHRSPWSPTPEMEADHPKADGAEVVVVRIEEEIDLSNADRLGAQAAKTATNPAARLVIRRTCVAYIARASIRM